MRRDCLNCGHPIGYHHGGTEPEMLCTCKDCTCSGYLSEAVENTRTAPLATTGNT